MPMPNDPIREHNTNGVECWCNPTIEHVPGAGEDVGAAYADIFAALYEKGLGPISTNIGQLIRSGELIVTRRASPVALEDQAAHPIEWCGNTCGKTHEPSPGVALDQPNGDKR